MSLAIGKAALFFSFGFCLPLLLSLPLHAAELTLAPGRVSRSFPTGSPISLKSGSHQLRPARGRDSRDKVVEGRGFKGGWKLPLSLSERSLSLCPIAKEYSVYCRS